MNTFDLRPFFRSKMVDDFKILEFEFENKLIMYRSFTLVTLKTNSLSYLGCAKGHFSDAFLLLFFRSTFFSSFFFACKNIGFNPILKGHFSLTLQSFNKLLLLTKTTVA